MYVCQVSFPELSMIRSGFVGLGIHLKYAISVEISPQHVPFSCLEMVESLLSNVWKNEFGNIVGFSMSLWDVWKLFSVFKLKLVENIARGFGSFRFLRMYQLFRM